MERAVITGLGVVSPIGIGKEEYWRNLVNGKSGISDLTCIDTSSFPNHRGGEIKNLDARPFLSKDEIDFMERGSIMAIMAAKLAVEDSGITIDQMDRHRLAVSMGTTMGEIQALEKIVKIRVKEGEEKIPPHLYRNYAVVNVPANVAKALNINGRIMMIPNACAAGNFAVTYAFEMIKSKKADMVIAGGVDPFSWVAFTGFNRLGAVSHDVVRPYDRNSKGMMVSEGAGIMVMESLSAAVDRKARIYAEVIGYGLTCDANHMTAPNPDGIIRAMKMALEKANLRPDQIDSVVGHGTGTPSNDQAEMLSLGKIFGDQADELPVTSIKSMLGHTMGAASAIEALTSALIVHENIIPPTINYQDPHPEKSDKIRVVGNECFKKIVNYGMNNAMAFGGNNSSLIMKKFTGE